MSERTSGMKPTTSAPIMMGRGGGPGGMMSGPTEKPKNFKRTMHTLIRYLRPFWGSLLVVVLLAITSTMFVIVSPKILGSITNKVVAGYVATQTYDKILSHLPPGTVLPPGTTGRQFLGSLPPEARKKIPTAQLPTINTLDLSHRPSIDFAGIFPLILLLIGLYVVSALFNYAQGWVMSGISQRITFALRRDISQKINHLPLSYFDTRTHGDVLSRVTNDVDTVSQTLNQSLAQIVTSVTSIIGILIMMFSINWQMTLVALLVLPVSFSFVRMIIGESQGYFVQQQVSLGQMNGHVEEMFSGHMVMKAFNGEALSLATFQAMNTKLHESAWKSQFLSGLMMPIMMFVGNLGYVAVAVLGGWLAIQGSISIGDIQAFIQYMSQFTQPISQTANIANVLQSTAAAAERVFDFLAEADETPDPKSPPVLNKVQGAVEFEHVKFGYTPDKLIIHNFTATVAAGQRIAIVGPTGAGKTTLVNLLMRFYELNDGVITIDQRDISLMKRSDLRQMFGMVLQDSWLFHGTIAENIAYGKPQATHAEVVAAAHAAHADHFIRALPGGYNLRLNEEADNISQGEKQLLTIARAMLANPPILILDEATSSVDTRTESLIQAGMDTLMHDRTSFVIAHRLSTIQHADLILVMNDGNIVEQGRHVELLAKKGFYASLYNSQFGLGNATT
jgi:ATP-binding cassette subfamily B multidrug efflux pump